MADSDTAGSIATARSPLRPRLQRQGGVGVQFAYELYAPISGSRMPVQMMIADRTLDPPGDFGSEHTDALSTRDMGWLMGWSATAQEAFDNHLMGYRIGEDRRVLLPQMVCQDGFFVSHIQGEVELPDQQGRIPAALQSPLPARSAPSRFALTHIMPEQVRRGSSKCQGDGRASGLGKFTSISRSLRAT